VASRFGRLDRPDAALVVPILGGLPGFTRLPRLVLGLRVADNSLASPSATRSSNSPDSTTFFKRCGVRTELQQTGRGTRLLDTLFEQLSHLDVEQIYLITLRDGPAASFYTKHGFRPAARSSMFLRRFD
jgi:ribosomal protein S18 acetylase RimI-like enzyme